MNVDQDEKLENIQKTEIKIASLILYVGVLGWVFLTALLRSIYTLTASTAPGPASIPIEINAAMIHSLVLILPLSILAWVSRVPRYKSLYTAWLLAASSQLLLAPAHLIPVDEAQFLAVAQIFLFLVYIFLVKSWFHRKHERDYVKSNHKGDFQEPRPILWIWLVSGIVGIGILAPWVLNGALGSLLDTLLHILLAFEFSVAMSLLISQQIFPHYPGQTSRSRQDYFLLSTGIGGVILILTSSSAFPFGAMHILLLLSLPVLGWITSAIWLHWNISTPLKHENTGLLEGNGNYPTMLHGPTRLMLSLALAGPFLFIDADELAIVISGSMQEILFIALRCAMLSLVNGVVSAIILNFTLKAFKNQQRTSQHKNSNLLPALLSVLILVMGGWLIYGYAQKPQPVLNGERMFIIFKDQKDVSNAYLEKDYLQRRQFVYESLTSHALQTQTGIRSFLENLSIAYTPYYLVNAIETIDNPILRLYLETRPEVDRILDSPHLRPLPETTLVNQPGEKWQAPDDLPWNIEMVHADQVWNEFGVLGQGILIGQSDSGVQGDHPDLAAQYRGRDGNHEYSWLDPWNQTTSPVDQGGHGTHTLGTILGKHTGIAPEAEWIACVNLARNLGNPALYLDCMQFMLAPYPQGSDPFTQGEPGIGANILNNSWGCPEFEGCDSLVFLPAVKALESAGIFIVAGAGNDGPFCSTISSPLPLYDQVFAVGAMNSQGELAPFSSLGPVTADGSQRIKPDLVAPGVNVLSTVPGSSYASYSGTSMASPHVVGVVALMWSANPALVGDIQTTRQILIRSAVSYQGQLPDCQGSQEIPSTAVGYGVLDAFKAVQMALSFNK